MLCSSVAVLKKRRNNTTWVGRKRDSKGSRDLLPDKKSRRPYIYKFLSLFIPSLFFFFFLDIESCILCWAPMSRETAPQTDQRRKSSQQRFPVESFSSHIQTGVEELHIIVACAFKQKKIPRAILVFPSAVFVKV